ncbi:hypothetical protein BJY52DRAFT_27379 [Lactarius psammicola]|nr:hypothetical protein BJY52DRAFT_27379 [Lactarius psammicola]
MSRQGPDDRDLARGDGCYPRGTERMKQMREEVHREYAELTDEKEVIRTSASESLCIIHFYHSPLCNYGQAPSHTRFKVFQHDVPACVCRKCPFPCRKDGHQGPTLCYLLYRYET